MKSATFPRDLRREAKGLRRHLLRIQYDAIHLDGEAVEVVGHAPEWVVAELRDLLRRWREASEAGVEVVQ